MLNSFFKKFFWLSLFRGIVKFFVNSVDSANSTIFINMRAFSSKFYKMIELAVSSESTKNFTMPFQS